MDLATCLKLSRGRLRIEILCDAVKKTAVGW